MMTQISICSLRQLSDALCALPRFVSGHVWEIHRNRWAVVYLYVEESLKEEEFDAIVAEADRIVGGLWQCAPCRHKHSVGVTTDNTGRRFRFYTFWLPMAPLRFASNFAVFRGVRPGQSA